jgi:hypothetical protein
MLLADARQPFSCPASRAVARSRFYKLSRRHLAGGAICKSTHVPFVGVTPSGAQASSAPGRDHHGCYFMAGAPKRIGVGVLCAAVGRYRWPASRTVNWRKERATLRSASQQAESVPGNTPVVGRSSALYYTSAATRPCSMLRRGPRHRAETLRHRAAMPPSSPTQTKTPPHASQQVWRDRLVWSAGDRPAWCSCGEPVRHCPGLAAC